MRVIFLVLALLLGLIIAGVAIINNEVVTVSYLFGQISLTLFMVILGSAIAGALFMASLGVFRSISTYMKSQGDRGLKKEMHNRVKTLEDEKKKLEDELRKQQKEREEDAVKAQAALEDDKRKLEEELRKQQKERNDEAAKVNAR